MNLRSSTAGLVACILIAPAALFLVLYRPLQRDGLKNACFVSFYGAGVMLHRNMGKELYDYDRQIAVQHEFTSALPFVHPAFEALLFLPLASFSFTTAYLIWSFCNLSLLGFIFFLLSRHGPPFGLVERLILIGVSFYPILATILEGEDSLLMLLVYSGVFLSLKNDQQFKAGCFLAVGLFKFQFILPFLFVLLVAKQLKWRFVYGFLCVGAVLFLVSSALVGPAGLVQYARLVNQTNRSANQALNGLQTAMPNLRGMLAFMAAGRISELILNLTVAILSMLLIVWVGQKIRTESVFQEGVFDLRFALALLVTLLVSYHMFLHDLSLLVLPAFLALKHFDDMGNRWNARKLSLALPLALFFFMELFLSHAGIREFRLGALAFVLVVYTVGVSRELSRNKTELLRHQRA